MRLVPPLVLGLVLVAGCARGEKVRVRVTPRVSRIDQPVHVYVTGTGGRDVVELRLVGRDARGRRWSSSARFRAHRGRVEPDHDAPLAGSYRGVWGAGLLASLSRPATGLDSFARRPGRPVRFRLEVLVRGKRAAAASFSRRLPAVDARALSVRDAGFYGRYYAPARPAHRAPPVLLFGGSEGGLPSNRIPALLAARGHPTLSLAYFAAPGLPSTLSRVPLEYFAGALRWLRARPEVAGSRVAVVGVSRGSEAAQLLGAHYPGLVGAVVAAVPSNSAICGLPACTGPAWTFRGRPVPYTRQFDFTQPTDDPAAVIPVERIGGPMLLVCGGRDAVWRSCAYSKAILARRRHFGRSGDMLYAYPRAGHFVGSLLPFLAVAPRWLAFKEPDERAREDLWPRVLSFLDRAPG